MGRGFGGFMGVGGPIAAVPEMSSSLYGKHIEVRLCILFVVIEVGLPGSRADMTGRPPPKV
jgi:hypothetical protein